MGLRMFIGNLQIGRIEIPGDQSVREAFHLAVKRLFPLCPEPTRVEGVQSGAP